MYWKRRHSCYFILLDFVTKLSTLKWQMIFYFQINNWFFWSAKTMIEAVSDYLLEIFYWVIKLLATTNLHSKVCFTVCSRDKYAFLYSIVFSPLCTNNNFQYLFFSSLSLSLSHTHTHSLSSLSLSPHAIWRATPYVQPQAATTILTRVVAATAAVIVKEAAKRKEKGERKTDTFKQLDCM